MRVRVMGALFLGAAAMLDTARRDESDAGCEMWEYWGAMFSRLAHAQLMSVRPTDVVALVDAGAREAGMPGGPGFERLVCDLGIVNPVSYDGTVALRAIVFEASSRYDEGGVPPP